MAVEPVWVALLCTLLLPVGALAAASEEHRAAPAEKRDPGGDDKDDEEAEEARERAQGKSEEERADERRRRALGRQGPATAGSPHEQGATSMVRLRVPGPPERFCAGVLLGNTPATVLVATSARCLAGDSADPPSGLELNFPGNPPGKVPIVRLEPRWAAAVRAHKTPPPGSDLAVVMGAVAPPPAAGPLFLLDPDPATLTELRERGLVLLGVGAQGPLGRAARTEGQGKGRNPALLTVRPRSGPCVASDAGGALTAFIPPETYLLGVVSPPSKAGGCEAVLPGADPDLRSFLLSQQSVLGIDVKRCARSAKTLHVTCADLGTSPLPKATVKAP